MQNPVAFSPTPTASTSSSETISEMATPDNGSTQQQLSLKQKSQPKATEIGGSLIHIDATIDNSDSSHSIPIISASAVSTDRKKLTSGNNEQEKSPAAAFLANFMCSNSQQLESAENSSQREMIGDYILLDHIGFGGNSIVRKARHEVTGNIVAIKIIETESNNVGADAVTSAALLAQQQLVYARLERELNIWRSLVHPNIVRLIKTIHVPHEQTYYVVNEYCSGGDLLTYRRNNATMVEEEMKLIFRQVCEGVRYLHKERNVCHKDLKLENILLWQPVERAQAKEQPLQVKICDFGLSVYANNNKSCCGLSNSNDKDNDKSEVDDEGQNSEKQEEEEEEEEAAGGSLAYVSPEQIRRKKVSLACRKTDIWSLGVVLYSLAVGQLPYENTFELKLQELILEGDYAIPENKHLSSSLKSLIQGCLAYLPENRLDIDQILSSNWLSTEAL